MELCLELRVREIVSDFDENFAVKRLLGHITKVIQAKMAAAEKHLHDTGTFGSFKIGAAEVL